MSYDQFEQSIRSGTPREVFVFRIGQNDYLGYTNGEEPVYVDVGTGTPIPVLCQPVPIKRSAIQSSTLVETTDLRVTMPKNVEISKLFSVFPPSYVVTLSLYRYYKEDGDQEKRRIWFGRVLSRSVDGPSSELQCDPFRTQMQRAGLRRTYSYECPHVLYGPSCKATRLAYTFQAVSVDGSKLRLNPAANLLDKIPEYFIGGTLEWNLNRWEARQIVGAVIVGSNLDLTVVGPMADLEPGTGVSLFMGCSHTENSCTVRFNNIANYGGQPWIPLENPIGKISTYL